MGTCESVEYPKYIKSFPYDGISHGFHYTMEVADYSKLMNLASETTMHRIVSGNCDEF